VKPILTNLEIRNLRKDIAEIREVLSNCSCKGEGNYCSSIRKKLALVEKQLDSQGLEQELSTVQGTR